MRKATLLLGLLLIATGLAHGAAPGKLSIMGQPTINIDPVCNSNASGTGWIKIHNEGPPGTRPVGLYLTATDLISKSPAKHSTARVTLSSDTKTLAGGEELWIRLDVSGVEQGEWETTIQNEYVDVGTVKIVKAEAAFHLGLDVPNANAPELTIVRGKIASFGLKNDDSKDYRVTWELTIDGQTVRSADPVFGLCCRYQRSVDQGSPRTSPAPAVVSGTCEISSAAASRLEMAGALKIPANGFKAVTLSPLCRWFPSRFVGLFKDQVSDGRLVIHRLDETCGCETTKTFNIKMHIANSSGNLREFFADCWIFLFLLAGGLTSVILNITIPNRRRRLTLKAKLAELETNISNLSRHLASRLRVFAGLEARLLQQKLRNASGFNANFEADMQSIDQGAKRLETRVQLSQQLDDIRTDFERLRSLHALPPAQIAAIEEKSENIIEIAKKADLADSDVQAAWVLIADLKKQLGPADPTTEAFKAELVRRVKMLKAELKKFDEEKIGGSTWGDVKKELCGPFDLITRTDPEDIQPEDYEKLQKASFKLEIIRDYVLLVEGIRDPEDKVRKRIVKYQEKLLDYLKNDSGEALLLAVSLLSEMGEGVFGEDIPEALPKVVESSQAQELSKAPEPSKARIQIQRFEVRQFEPCGFKLEFLDPRLDRATARDNWICQWTFRHSGEPDLTEEDWEVTHFFQQADVYEFHVRVISKKDGRIIEINDPNFSTFPTRRTPQPSWMSQMWRFLREKRFAPLPIQPKYPLFLEVLPKKKVRYDSGVLGTLQFLLALFVVLIGMLAGAKDQLLKLDLIPSLIAIFLLGFNADTIKKLLANPQGGPASGR